MRATATIAALIIGSVIAVALLWGVSEIHYRNCLTAADLRGGSDRIESILDDKPARDDLVDGCSRLPF